MAHSSAMRAGECSGSDDAAGADLEVVGSGRERRPDHARVGIGTTECVEVSLGGPDRLEAVPVGPSSTVEQEAVPVVSGLLSGGEVEEAERERARGAGSAPVGGGGAGDRPVLGCDHDVEASCEGPQELEHRDVERQAGDGQPRSGWVVVDDAVHRREEVDDVAVLEHDALRRPGRTRGVDHVRQIAAAVFVLRRTIRCHGVAARMDHGDVVGELDRRHAGVDHDDAQAAVADHESDAFGRVARIEGHVGRAAGMGREHGRHHVGAPAECNADEVAASHPCVGELGGDRRDPLPELAVRHRRASGGHGRRIRVAFDPLCDQSIDGGVTVDGDLCGVQVVEQAAFVIADQGEVCDACVRCGEGAHDQPFDLVGDPVEIVGGEASAEPQQRRPGVASDLDGERWARRGVCGRCAVDRRDRDGDVWHVVGAAQGWSSRGEVAQEWTPFGDQPPLGRDLVDEC